MIKLPPLRLLTLFAAAVHVVHGSASGPSTVLPSDAFSSSIGVVWFGGLVKDASEITKHALDFLLEINCDLQTPVHIVAGHGGDALLEAYKNKVSSCGEACAQCSDFIVQEQDPFIEDVFPNRIDRLAYLRQIQRDEMRKMNHRVGETPEALQENDFVVLLDLDLSKIPTIKDVAEVMSFMAKNKDDAATDVVCANGVLASESIPYDNYATIILPDTWLYPTAGRLDPNPYIEEDPKAAKEFVHSCAKAALFAEYESKVKTTKESLIPVKTCYGGLAIYRAKIWFNDECDYMYNYKDIYDDGLHKYLDVEYKRVCEHTTFNNCLAKQSEDFTVAVHSGLVTKYHDTTLYISMDGDLKVRRKLGPNDKAYSSGIGVGNGQGEAKGVGKEKKGFAVGQNKQTPSF